MITTVTPNPALDITYNVQGLIVGASNRVADVHERPGGKGVNVSRVLHQLGHATVATGWATPEFNARLRASDIPASFVDARDHVRRTIAVADGPDVTMLLEPGSRVRHDAVDTLADAITNTEPDVVAICGSVPDNLPATIVADLAATIQARTNATCVIDTSGPPLHAAMHAPGTILKVNHHEAAAALAPAGAGPDEPASPPAVAVVVRGLVELGHPTVAVTMGADGLVLAHDGQLVHARLPTPVPGNPTGAGDAATAALCRGLVTGDNIHDIARDMVALSAAAVRHPLAGTVDPGHVHELAATITLEDLT